MYHNFADSPECRGAWYAQLVKGIVDSLNVDGNYVVGGKSVEASVVDCIGSVDSDMFRLFEVALRESVEKVTDFITNRLEYFGYKETGVAGYLASWKPQSGTWRAWNNLVDALHACEKTPEALPPEPVPLPASPTPPAPPAPSGSVDQAGVPWFWLLGVGVVLYVWGRHS